MKAYFTEVIDNQSKLLPRDIEIPVPQKDEILFKVKSTALNRGGFIVGGVMHGNPNKPSGTEAAGEIVDLGSDIKNYKIGDKIMGRVLGTDSGSFAEYALIKEYQTMRIPDSYTWEQAAAIPVSFLAAYDAIVTYGNLSKDQITLITSISSAIGASGLVISKILGAKVIGTSTSKKKLDALARYGMDFGIITPEQNLTKKLLDYSNGGINLVVNCLGGSIFNDAMNALSFKGIIVNVGYMDGIDTVPINIRKVHAQRYSIHGISNAFVTKDDIIQTVEGFKRNILPYLDKDNNKPIIDKVFHFDDIDQGREYMMSNSQIGKIVITL